jgi:hypothetical protein
MNEFGIKTASSLNKNVKIRKLPKGLNFCCVLFIHIHRVTYALHQYNIKKIRNGMNP